MEYSSNKINEKIKNHNFYFKKNFGQNFITDENIINNIVNKSNINDETLVIEIGPGAGALTYKLSKVAKNVLCYEIDTTLKNILEENLQGINNVDIIYNDFLKSNILEDIKKYNYEQIYVVANLPYYITTPIIMKLIDDDIPIDKVVVMVQKEVGNRFKALPNSKEYNALSVLLSYYFDIKKIMDVSKNVFIPKPNVDSIVIQMVKKDKLYLKNKTFFNKLVKDCFKQKRKNLKNNLQSYDLDKISSILNKYGFDLTNRAEQLSLEIFVELANILC